MFFRKRFDFDQPVYVSQKLSVVRKSISPQLIVIPATLLLCTGAGLWLHFIGSQLLADWFMKSIGAVIQ